MYLNLKVQLCVCGPDTNCSDDMEPCDTCFILAIKKCFELADILSEESICKVVPVIMLQLYINPCLHLFVTPALVLFSFKPAKKLFGGTHFLVTLFMYLFIYFHCTDF